MAVGLALAALSVGSSIYSGVQQSKQNMYNAEAAWNSATMNAKLSEWWGNYNADSIYNVGLANAINTKNLGAFNAAQARNAAEFNASMVRSTAEYNARLQERDAQQILEIAEIDVEDLNRQIIRTMGQQRTYYANAGVQVNKEDDTPQQVAIDTATQRDIDAAIIRRSADMEAGKYLDAAAMGRWEGEVGARLEEFSGEQQAWSSIAQAGMQSATIMNEATANRNMTRWRGQLDSALSIWQGGTEASNFQFAANQALENSRINAAMTAGQAYMGYKFMNTNTVQPTSSVGKPRFKAANAAVKYNTGPSNPRASTPGTSLLVA